MTEQTIEPGVEEAIKADVDETEQTEKAAEQVDEVVGKLDEANRGIQRLMDLELAVQETESEWNEAKATAKEAKTCYDAALSRLRSAIRQKGDPQKCLFDPHSDPDADTSEETPAEPPHDDGGDILLDKMTKAGLEQLGVNSNDNIGMTEAKIQVIKTACDGETFAALEAWQQKEAYWDQGLPGIGGEWLTRFQDTHLAIRLRYPIPSEAEDDEPTEGEDSQEETEFDEDLDETKSKDNNEPDAKILPF